MDFGSGNVESAEAELSELRHMGASIGLTSTQVEDTITVWSDWSSAAPTTHRDFGRISEMLALRATNQPWRPAGQQGMKSGEAIDRG